MEAAAAGNPTPARVAERYRLVRPLGSGSSASVYVAHDAVEGRTVALKIGDRDGEAGGSRVQREFEFLSALAHPQLPDVYELGRDPASGAPFFTMEIVEGRELAAAGPELDDGAVALLLTQACRVLAFLHERGIVHGDVKPANLLVARDAAGAPRLKLIDLGLSSSIGEREPGRIRGTPRYASRSVLDGRPPSPRSDLFALGASFLDALGARAPGWPGRPDGNGIERERAPARVLPAPLAAVLGRLVAPDEDARYQSARDVLRALEAERDDGEAGSAPFVGRARELALADERLQRLRQGGGRPRVTVLVGSSGAGKTRLLDEIGRRAALGMLAVLRVRASHRGGAPWELLTGVVRRAAALAPDGDAGYDAQRVLGSNEPGAGGFASDVAEALRSAARQRPLVLLIDDAAPDDEPLWSTLRRVRGGSDAPLWIVVALRADAHAQTPPESDDVWRLGALAAEDASRLVEALFAGRPFAREALDAIVRATGGHPGFAESAARAVARSLEEGVDPDATTVREAVHSGLPEDLASALRLRWRALPPAPRELALELAVSLRPVSVAWLEAYGAGAPAELRAGVAALVRAGVLARSEGTEEELFEFRSDTFRRVLARELSPQRARELHRRAAAAWVAVGASEARAEIVTEHFLAGDDARGALRHGRAAVRELVRHHAPGRAVALAEALLARAGAGAPERAELLELHGDALCQSGDWGRTRDAYERALSSLAAPPSLERQRLLRKLAVACDGSGQGERAREHLHAALALGNEDKAEVVRIWEILGQVEYKLGRAREAKEALERGLAELEHPEEDFAAASLWNNLGIVACEGAEYALARRFHEKALAIRDRHGDLEGRSRSLTNLANAAYHSGDVARARELYEQSLSLKRRLGNRQAIAVTLSNLALLDQAQGDYGRAIQRSEEALRWRAAVGDVGGQVRTRTNLAELWLEKGHFKTALQHVEGALALARRAGEQGTALSGALVTRAALELEIGRYDAALSVAQEGMPIALRNGSRSDEARLRLVLAEAGHELGRTADALEDARTAVRAFRASEDPRRLGQALLVESRVALAARDADGADASARAAAELAASRHLPLLEARAAYQRGVVALALGATGAASKHLHHAKDVAYRLSIPELQARVYDALAVFHYGEGRSERALLWLRRCTGVFRSVVASIDDAELESAYVETPWRAAAIARMRSWLHAAQPT